MKKTRVINKNMKIVFDDIETFNPVARLMVRTGNIIFDRWRMSNHLHYQRFTATLTPDLVCEQLLKMKELKEIRERIEEKEREKLNALI